MLNLSPPIEAAHDAITSAQPTLKNNDVPQPLVVITEQEVMFGTAAVVRPRSTSITRRLIGALGLAAALRPPPPRPHYAHRAQYLESARMSREMEKL